MSRVSGDAFPAPLLASGGSVVLQGLIDATSKVGVGALVCDWATTMATNIQGSFMPAVIAIIVGMQSASRNLFLGQVVTASRTDKRNSCNSIPRWSIAKPGAKASGPA